MLYNIAMYIITMRNVRNANTCIYMYIRFLIAYRYLISFVNLDTGYIFLSVN